jgi:hypothetical protein
MVSRFCTRCGQMLPPDATSCPRCNAPVGAAPSAAASPAPSAGPAPSLQPAAESASPARRTCGNCRAAMRWIGHYSLRATGAPGAGGMAGAPPDVTETLLPFSVYYCQTCGKFDFYYPGT